MCQFYHDKFDFLEFSQRNRGRIRYDNSSRDKVGRSDRRGRYEMPDVRGRGERIFWGGRDERSDMRGLKIKIICLKRDFVKHGRTKQKCGRGRSY